MHVLAALLALALIMVLLWDAFETILLPRRPLVGIRLSRFVLRTMWRGWAAVGQRIQTRNRREDFLGIYALLSLIELLVIWALGLVLGFGVLHWATGSHLSAGRHPGFAADLYMSGTTFFTLGLGDVTPTSTLSRWLTVLEAGMGFGFLALVISYLPVLYQSFSRREARITMLDEWAGSPPTGAVILRRCFESRDPAGSLNALLRDWEIASAEMLETHLSYPLLAFFRSQHDNQSWLASVAAILDVCAVVIVGVPQMDPFQARLTFAIARHMLVDVSQNLIGRGRHAPPPLEPESYDVLLTWLAEAGVPATLDATALARLAELRGRYVPYARSLSGLLLMPLPAWAPAKGARFNWETTAWNRAVSDGAH